MNEKSERSEWTIKLMTMLLLFSFLAVEQASAILYMTDYPVVQITKVRQDSNPAVPGEVVDLYLEVENQGGAVAENVSITLVPSYPFSLYGDDTGIRTISSLSSYFDETDGVQIEYRLLVDGSATSEAAALRFEYTYSGVSSATEIEVLVEDSQTDFEVTGRQVSENVAELFVVNSGQGPAESILMFVDGQRAYSIEDLEAGAMASEYVSLPGGFDFSDLLEVSFQYTDSIDLRRSSTSFATVYPISVSDIEVMVRDVSGSTVTVAVVNSGNFPLYAVSVKPVGYSSATQSIIGNLDAGDYSLATFTMQSQNATASQMPQGTQGNFNSSAFTQRTQSSDTGKFEVHYTDFLGERRTSLEDAGLSVSSRNTTLTSGVYSSSMMGRRSSVNWGYVVLGLVGLAGLGGTLFWFRRRRAGKKK